MTRAGKEPSEDLQRRLAAICTACGLNAGKKINRLMQDRKQRVVIVTASPPVWEHESAAVTLMAFVSTTGGCEGVRIQCAASNDDPLATIWSAPTVRNAYVTLEIAEEALKQRQEIINCQADNPDITRFDFEPFLWEAPGQDFKFASM